VGGRGGELVLGRRRGEDAVRRGSAGARAAATGRREGPIQMRVGATGGWGCDA
jgi:hypothetical protein